MEEKKMTPEEVKELIAKGREKALQFIEKYKALQAQYNEQKKED